MRHQHRFPRNTLSELQVLLIQAWACQGRARARRFRVARSHWPNFPSYSKIAGHTVSVSIQLLSFAQPCGNPWNEGRFWAFWPSSAKAHRMLAPMRCFSHVGRWAVASMKRSDTLPFVFFDEGKNNFAGDTMKVRVWTVANTSVCGKIKTLESRARIFDDCRTCKKTTIRGGVDHDIAPRCASQCCLESLFRNG